MELQDMQSIVRRLESEIAAPFVGREEEARVVTLALLTRQHAVLIGEPGIAKTALLERAAKLLKCNFFRALLTKHTLPDELIGPIDPVAYKEGRFVRNTRGRLPTAEIAFIDEIFKGNSETLNALLSIMNERVFIDADGSVIRVPLWSLFGASNEVPVESELTAFYDRFLIRHFVKRIDATLLEKAVVHNITGSWSDEPVASLEELRRIYDAVTEYMRSNAGAIAKVTAQVVIALREHGVFISDRTAVSSAHLPRLIATLAFIYGFNLKNAAINAVKYILPDKDSFDAYKKVLDKFVPQELRLAQEKLDQARAAVAAKKLEDAKMLALEAMNTARSLFDKPSLAQLHAAELKEILEQSERLIQQLQEIERTLEKIAGK